MANVIKATDLKIGRLSGLFRYTPSNHTKENSLQLEAKRGGQEIQSFRRTPSSIVGFKMKRTMSQEMSNFQKVKRTPSWQSARKRTLVLQLEPNSSNNLNETQCWFFRKSLQTGTQISWHLDLACGTWSTETSLVHSDLWPTGCEITNLFCF